MSEVQSVERMAVYYQEFHHKCVTWYITIIGFFIAAVIAAPSSAAPAVGQIFGIVLVAASLVCGALFFACIAHYGARIKYLTNLLDAHPAPIPDDWRVQHRNVGWEIHGVGSAFFFALLIGMQVVLIFLAILRYWP